MGEPCFPKDGDNTNYITNAQAARANMEVCYGEYIFQWGVPIEIVWSDWVTYTWRLALTTRYNHNVRVENTTLSSRTIDASVGWDVRRNVSLGQDVSIESEVFNETLWGYGNVTNFAYELTDSAGGGIYFMTQRQIEIDDYATAGTYPGVLNHELPRFECPFDSTSFCSFQGT